MPTPPVHRPVITRHGTYCTCEVFCGSDSQSWWGHARDRKILDPDHEFNPNSLGKIEYAITSLLGAARQALKPLLGEQLRREETHDDELG